MADGLWIPETVAQYHALHEDISAKEGSEWEDWTRSYCEADLFYLARFILNTRNPDWLVNGKQALDHPFALRFSRQLQFEEEETLFLIAREHLKSTLSTFCRTIHIVINDPNATIGIFSDTLKLSLKFARRIAVEMVKNPHLYRLWPHIFYANLTDARKNSPQWNLGEGSAGVTVKRSINVAEATVTPVGLDTAVETGPHYQIRRYDDIVTRRNTRQVTLMQKTRDNLDASHSLGKEGGYATYVGTTYHPLDAYQHMQNEGIVKRVVHEPCWRENGQGEPQSIYYSMEYLKDKEHKLRREEFAIQWLLDPQQGRIEKVDEEWITRYDPNEPVPGYDNRTMREHLARMGNTFMVVDGAGQPEDGTSDYTVIQIWSAQPDERVVLLDAIRDQLDPAQRIAGAMRLYQKWGQFRFQWCNWEQYGMDSDIFWCKREQLKTSNHFRINKVQGYRKNEKYKRITGRAFPALKERRVVLPDTLPIECQYLGGGILDYAIHFVQVILAYPLVEFDDDVDCFSRLFEPDHPLIFPNRPMKEVKRDAYSMVGRMPSQGERNWVA